jgi:DNA-binding phage protein
MQTRNFDDIVQDRIRREPAFGRALVEEAIDYLLNDNFDAAKLMLRDYINATIGFPALAAEVGTPATSLMRMLGPGGNPQAKRLLPVIAAIRRREGLAGAQALVRAYVPAEVSLVDSLIADRREAADVE